MSFQRKQKDALYLQSVLCGANDVELIEFDRVLNQSIF